MAKKKIVRFSPAEKPGKPRQIHHGPPTVPFSKQKQAAAPPPRPTKPPRWMFDRSFEQLRETFWIELPDNLEACYRAVARMAGQMRDALIVHDDDVIEALGLRDRLCTILNNGGIVLVRELQALTYSELRKIYHVGSGVAYEVMAALAFHGRELREESGAIAEHLREEFEAHQERLAVDRAKWAEEERRAA